MDQGVQGQANGKRGGGRQARGGEGDERDPKRARYDEARQEAQERKYGPRTASHRNSIILAQSACHFHLLPASWQARLLIKPGVSVKDLQLPSNSMY